MLNWMLHTDKSRAAVRFFTDHGGLLVCGLFLLVGLGLAGDYGMGVDEVVQRDAARANLRYILGPVDRVAPRSPQDRFYGVAFELPLLMAERFFGLEDYYYYVHRFRLTVTHLFFVAGGFFCYLLAYRMFNNRLIALFALLLFLLHPRIYAHSFFNSKDLPFLSMFAIALYLTERAFRKDTLGAFLLLGIAVGVATNLRIMGLMLLLAVVGLRVLDVGLARDWGERKGILARGGLFALAVGLTWYALSPDAWGDPLAQLTGALSLTTDHPHTLPALFQGVWFNPDELPAHYGLTWFLITMPPPVLLVGVVGMAAVLARGLAGPKAVWGNGQRRFWLLLAGCCGLPPLAVALAGSTYDGWRHLYFIYAPFVLLTAGGLYWLAGSRHWLWQRRAGVYGLFGLGLGLTLLQMAQLHPLQQVYFNFLADRTTPNYLQTQYELDSWKVSLQGGLEYALGRHPGETLAVNKTPGYPAMTLPREERRRLIMASPVHDLDYAWGDAPEQARRPDTAFNTFQLSRYNNPVVSMRVLEGSRMTAAMRAGYEELYRAAVAGEPIIRGEYDVYLEGRRVTFVKEDCQRGERAGRFRVKVYRAGPEAQPGGIPDLAVYNHNANYGARVGGRCLAVLQLRDYPPDYPIDYLVAGRYSGDPATHAIWEGAHSFLSPGLPERMDGLRANRPGATAGAGFELYRQGNRLIYYREGCTAADTAALFFLHITPEDVGDLPPERREHGFDSWGFHFGQRGVRLDGQCLATVELPDYAIARIRTEQEGHWEFRGLPPVEPGFLREQAAALAGVAADYRGEFDLYWRDGELIYRREGCGVADTAAEFFLHIRPVNGADLAAERRGYGFEVRDFEFGRWGGHFDGICVAVVQLPGYEIAGIRTGQYAAGTGEVWAAELESS